MKVQEVILRAMAGKLKWWEAAEILGITDRTMRRWRERYEQWGYDGLYDRRKGRPSPKRAPVETVERVLGLYQEQYFDFNVRHFHEKLVEEHGIDLSYTWVKLALQGAGLVSARRRRRPHRRRRPRRPLPGMLLHIDGSKHQWFQDERWYDLLTILDDANSEIYYGQLVEEEATAPVMRGWQEVIEEHGLFCALYSDRASHFFVTPKAGEGVDRNRLTQVGRALKELGIQIDSGLLAASPWARRAELSHLARATSARVAGARDHHLGRRQCLPAGALHRGVEPALPSTGEAVGNGLCEGPAQGLGVGVLHTARTNGEWRQHGRAEPGGVPDREEPLA